MCEWAPGRSISESARWERFMSSKPPLSQRLREIRQMRGLKQLDLSRRTGLQPSAISQFETGQRVPSPQNLIKIADALGVALDSIFGRNLSSPNARSRERVQDLLNYVDEIGAGDLDTLVDFAAFLARKPSKN